MIITATDKLHCAERELKYRQRVYERLVERGTMTKRQCDRELELMQAIAEDYQKLAAQEALV
jgi:hypothetical protein